jgi:hypothetical protein
VRDADEIERAITAKRDDQFAMNRCQRARSYDQAAIREARECHIRIRHQREMAGAAQRDRARAEASGSPSG